MKKNLLKVIFVLSFGLFLNGQTASAQSFKDGTNTIQVGVGFPNLLAQATSVYSIFGNVTSSSLPPLHLGFEHGITDNISVGLWLGYATQTLRWDYVGYNTSFQKVTYKEGWDYSWIVVGARGNYHFATGEHFDPYAGIFLGYNIVSAKYITDDPAGSILTGISAAGSSFGFGAQVGFNYYFSDSFGCHVELGYGVAIINLGLSLKF